MIRILATGDTHIEEGSRFEECKRVLRWFVSEVERAKPDLVLHPGDVYDKASTPAEREFAAEFFQALARVCPVVLVKGNHDAPRDLQILAQLEAAHEIQVVEDARVVRVRGVAVAAMAWPSRAGQIDDGVAREAVRATLSGLGAELCAHDGPKVLLGHFDVSGATTGAGQPLIGGSLTVSLADLALAGADAIVMGHIHQAQDWLVGETPAAYCGSPYRTDFGEMEPKSVLSVGFEFGRAAIERMPTPARPMVDVEAHWHSELGAFLELDPHAPPPAGADVRFRYTVDADRRAIAGKAAAEIKAAWLAEGAGCATVKLEPEVLATTRAREGTPAVAQARTLAEKLPLFWTSRKDVPDPIRASRLLSRLALLEETPR